MAIKDIKAKIISDAEIEANKIINEATNKAKEIKEEAEKEGRDIKSKILKRINQEILF
jgi:vacuolar-type H+-ATPase subunit E/Vma4